MAEGGRNIMPVAGEHARPRSGRRPPLTRLLILALVSALLGAVGTIAVGRIPNCAFTPAAQCTRVLFIGNSYTSVNDLPGTFARLAASGGHRVETGMIAPGGAFLSDEAANPDTARTIAGTAWDRGRPPGAEPAAGIAV
jgi:hypothetical protein